MFQALIRNINHTDISSFLVLGTILFFFSFCITFISVPICKRIAKKANYLDIPNSEGHKLHDKAIPLLGGVAIFSGIFFPVLISIFFLMSISYIPVEIKDGFLHVRKQLFTIFFCSFASLLLGLRDDKNAMSAKKKFILQTIIFVIAILLGDIRITLFFQHPIFTFLITLLWFLFITNGVNFFDNMDGLAAGTATIAFLFFTFVCYIQGQFFIAALAVVATGATMAFLCFNYSPASIFMGDAGSHLLGFLIAVISTKTTFYNSNIASSKFSVLIPIFILAIPIFDTIAVVIIRILNHKPVYIGDHNHISHRFFRMGLSKKESVLFVHLLCIISGLGVLPLLWGDIKTCFILLLQECVLLLMLTFLQFHTRRN